MVTLGASDIVGSNVTLDDMLGEVEGAAVGARVALGSNLAEGEALGDRLTVVGVRERVGLELKILFPPGLGTELAEEGALGTLPLFGLGGLDGKYTLGILNSPELYSKLFSFAVGDMP